MGACLALGELSLRMLPAGWNNFAEVSLSIVGWVAMWRPLEIYLYDWWPLREEQRMFGRLARMSVRLVLPA